MNKICLIGRLTKDITLKNINGTDFIRFSVAVQRDYSKEDREKRISENKQTVDFVYVSVWGNLAKAVSSKVGKGNRIAIEGKLQINRVKKDEQNRIYPEIIANSIDFIDYKSNIINNENIEDDLEDDIEENYLDEDELNDDYFY